MSDISHLKGKRVLVPLINRSVPVIFDEYVDREFGTGALKVTPAHDINDYNLGLKYKLEVIDTFNPDGTMSAAAHCFTSARTGLPSGRRSLKTCRERTYCEN